MKFLILISRLLIAFFVIGCIVVAYLLFFYYPQRKTDTLPDIASFNRRCALYHIPLFRTDGEILCFEYIYISGRNACLFGKFDDDLEVFQNLAEQISLKSIEDGLPFDTPNAHRSYSSFRFYLVSMEFMEGTRILDEIRRNFTVTGDHCVVLDENLYYFTFDIRTANYAMIIEKVRTSFSSAFMLETNIANCLGGTERLCRPTLLFALMLLQASCGTFIGIDSGKSFRC